MTMSSSDATIGSNEPKESINVLVMACGSVAAIKLPQLLSQLRQLCAESERRLVAIKVVTTEPAIHFYDYKQLSAEFEILRDCDEWSQWSQMGDPVLHIELRKWATVGVVAPIDANTLAKVAVGMCDNLLTCVLRAWDADKPLLFCPAMNVNMWSHPITERNLQALHSFGYKQVGPIAKRLACGDTGMGAMAEVTAIVKEVKNILNL